MKPAKSNSRMPSEKLPVAELSPADLPHRTIIIVGAYGSGKSEVAVNLAAFLTQFDDPVAIADLDIVNPYFRSREAAEELDNLEIRTINPKGEFSNADLPIILPEIRGAIEKSDGWLILDVGGDDVGARILSYMSGAFSPGEYDLLMVLNARRPFTADLEGSVKAMKEISTAARLEFTGIISNTHLIEKTTPEVVAEGVALAAEVSESMSLPVRFVSAVREVLKLMKPDELPFPALGLQRRLLKPWER